MLKKYCKLNINNYYKMNYIVYLPEEIKPDLPVLLFLHGIRERGDKVSDIEKYALPKYMNNFDIPYIAIAPQCSNNNFWDYHLNNFVS